MTSDNVRHLPVRTEVVDAELVDEPPSQAVQARARRAGYRQDVVVVVRTARTVATHHRTLTVLRHALYVALGAKVLLTRAWEARSMTRWERIIRGLQESGQYDQLIEAMRLRESALRDRHSRRMDWIAAPGKIMRRALWGVASVAALLLLIGGAMAYANRRISDLIAPARAVADIVAWICWVVAICWGPLILAAPWLLVLLLWHLGRRSGRAPDWVMPADHEGVDGRAILPTADMILSALRHLRIPALDDAFKQGYGTAEWPLQIFEGPVVPDGQGYSARLRLPQGCPVEKIVDKKATLAHNLVRTQREVWVTEPSAAVLGLWMANPGALSGPAPAWPLLADLEHAQTDWFKSVPVGFDLRGDVVNGRFFECNWALGGAMGSGKSTLAITATAGAILDPIVEVDVFVCAPNFDYEPMRPRLRTLMDGTGDEVADAAVACMKELYDSIEYRGQALKDKELNPTGSRTLTRGMALKDPRLRPRMVIIDECQRVFADTDRVDKVAKKGPTRGEIATDVAVQLVNAGRKYGIALILLTPEPTGNSLPRKLMSVFTHKACGAIGDQTSNDAVLNTGSYKSGISAVGLDPKDDNGLNDCGTLMTRGFMSKPGLVRSCYISSTDLARVTDRAMELRKGVAPAAIEAPDEREVRDLLDDVRQVMAGKPRMRSDAVRRFLADEWPAVYGGWSAQQFAAALREAGKAVGLDIRSGRVDGMEGQRYLSLDEVLDAVDARAEQTDDTPENP